MRGSDIEHARNFFASHVIADKSITHLLSIDTDTGFATATVAKLLAANKPIIGAVYVRREIDLNALAQHAKTSDLKTAMAKASQFLVCLLDNGKLTVEDGACRVAAIGMGLSLIGRGVFDQLVATKTLREQPEHEHGERTLRAPLYGFYDRIRDGNSMISEDFSFCKRWSDLCGGQIWALPNEEISHAGEFCYSARLLDSFKVDR